MIHVLFVDDDLSVLGDLKNMLQMTGASWEIALASSGAEALEIMDAEDFDVICSDLQMPEMDGAELLQIVRDTHPYTMRILMSGNADTSYTSQLVPHAHQYLHKPCQPRMVRSVIERAWELGQRLRDPELKAILGNITDLPRPPQSIMRLNAILGSPDADVDSVAEIVGSDMGLTVKLFQLVNSASYGLSRSINEVREAVAYLGMNTVRNLAISVEVFRSVSGASTEHSDYIAYLHEHGAQVASIARQLVVDRRQASEAFVAGLLHDVGLLVVAAYLPDRFTALRETCANGNLSIRDVEFEVLGANHSDLGAYLLNLWGVPYGVVEAVARHHDACDLPERKMDATHAVAIAEAIANSNHPDLPMREDNEEALGRKYLEELGLLERVAGLLAAQRA